MSIQLKLDAAAVTVLFPEGSPVRLELQQAVINEITRKIVDRELAKTRQYIDSECRRIAEAALRAEGLTSKMWSGVKIADSTEKLLKESATNAANAAVNSSLAAAMAPLLLDMDTRIQRALDDRLRIRVDELAKSALRNALK